MTAVSNHLKTMGLRWLELRTLRPEGAAMTALQTMSARRAIDIEQVSDDVSFETDLPDDWEGYLGQLNGKQRHEVRRKIRRLEGHGPFTYQAAPHDGQLGNWISIFLRLFQSNRQDKAEFMNRTMERYFYDLIKNLANHHMLQLYFLLVDDQPAATVLCFDYLETRYLYNSGYDERYQDLSVGILSKLFSIRSGIEKGCRQYDFLKGAEIYKKRIGGREVPLWHCKIKL
jgi:CelD/BcsL family acetyltransferase involved in cellulose biosynthesis